MKYINKLLNSLTMYKVVLYGLMIMVVYTVILGFFGVLPYGGLELLCSALILMFSSELFNIVFAKLFGAPRNAESSVITGLILFFVLSPIINWIDIEILILVSALAMLTKYIFAYSNRHLFNPVALAAFIIGVLGYGQAIWWVGSAATLPATLIIGFLILKKIRRFHLFFAFAITALICMAFFGMRNGLTLSDSLLQGIISYPLIFFGSVMLTEPLTSAPTKKMRIIYGAIVGILFGSQYHFGPIFSSPEFALVVGNIFAYSVSFRHRPRLKLKEKRQLASDIYEFIFTPSRALQFSPGQYMEWSLPHESQDIRGMRRYFTIASSPTEKEVKIGVRMQANNGSSFKGALSDMKTGDDLLASSIDGDFVLPSDTSKKLVFIAGGIGITPFRSMIQYMSDRKEKRDIVLFYAATDPTRFAYKEIFDAASDLGLKVFYIISGGEVPKEWTGLSGILTKETIANQVPDFKEREFYLSGPNAMVDAYKKMLSGLSISSSQIKTDYFPGF